jgi:hypothetical protein
MEEVQSIIIKEGRNEKLTLKGDRSKEQIEMREKQDENLWRQNSIIRWLKKGYGNS